MWSSPISLNGYGCKIRKVSRCRPAVSNETILATRQEFFFTKVAPIQSITGILLLDFSLMLLSWMFQIFISSDTNIYFFIKNLFFRMLIFQWTRHSNVFICYFGSERDHQLRPYATSNWWGWGLGGIQNAYSCVQGEGVSRLMCT